MGIDDSVVVDEKVEHSPAEACHNDSVGFRHRSWSVYLALLLIAASVYVSGIVSPPSLQDDVDAVQAQIARNMQTSGDWVTARLDGIPYLEKAPLVYWMMACSFKVFGVHDWAARLPIVLFCVGLCLLTAAFGIWAFGRKAGFYAGLCMATCVGLYLFTRILIPDVILTFTIALAMWALLRLTDEAETHPRLWAFLLAASLGTGLLLKSLIGVLFPVAAGLIYLFLTKQLFQAQTWKRLHPFSGLLVILLIAVPWHVLATLRNPPYFSFSLHSGPGEYHGFLWFFFINEQLLRFLNLRYPRDYNTVPRLWFWLFHLAWLFPWSVYFPAIAKLSFRPVDRAGRARLLALCWVGFVLVFFTFSTTQEYYSMPCYPALALLLGSAMATEGAWIRRGTRILTAVSSLAAATAIAILVLVWKTPTPGDIFGALTVNPLAYTLSLGHMEDLTLQSFAYLRLPLLLAAIACAIGAVGTFRASAKRAFVCATLMMLLFFQAARLALVVFEPDLSSRPLADAILRSPEGKLIVDRHYYTFSSIFFYTGRPALLLNGRRQNLSYGSYAPGSPNVFIDDAQFKELWLTPERYYLVANEFALPRLEGLVGREKLNVIAESGGKFVVTNIPLPNSVLSPDAEHMQGSAPSGDQPSSNRGNAPHPWPEADRRQSTIKVLGFSRSPHLEMRLREREWINPASVPQTRYILLGSALFASSQGTDSRVPGFAPLPQSGVSSDRVASAVRFISKQCRSIPGASLHCMSPEEDA
jgi:4-amino-4-deoxy-L-arabinose transferase-like glycosyltransferase